MCIVILVYSTKYLIFFLEVDFIILIRGNGKIFVILYLLLLVGNSHYSMGLKKKISIRASILK